MSDRTSAQPTSRRSFLRQGAAAAMVLPAAVTVIAACSDSEAAVSQPARPVKTDTLPPSLTPLQKADRMDAMHEAGSRPFRPRPRARATS